MNENILITGSGGSIGTELIKYINSEYQAIYAFDNCESNLWNLKQICKQYGIYNVVFVHGDTKIKNHLEELIPLCDTIIHLAAMKSIDSEEDVGSMIDNDVEGTRNIVDLVGLYENKKFIFASSDKACLAQSNLGCCKQLGENYTLRKNKFSQSKFSVMRWVNVDAPTNGNVFELWEKQRNNCEPFTITDMRMSRYFLKLEILMHFIKSVIRDMQGGEIFLPYVIKQTNIFDKLKELYPYEYENYIVTGIRKHEKLLDLLWTPEEYEKLEEVKGKYFIIR